MIEWLVGWLDGWLVGSVIFLVKFNINFVPDPSVALVATCATSSNVGCGSLLAFAVEVATIM